MWARGGGCGVVLLIEGGMVEVDWIRSWRADACSVSISLMSVFADWRGGFRGGASFFLCFYCGRIPINACCRGISYIQGIFPQPKLHFHGLIPRDRLHTSVAMD